MAASAGNHAQALAWHGKTIGIPATVVMPTVAPMAKVEKCRAFGANVVIQGAHIGEAKEYAMANFPELRYINGYDDPEIIAGAGTLGVEMLEQVPDADVIVVPVGGAGLIAGVALAAKTLNPKVRLIGVEPRRCASYSAALLHTTRRSPRRRSRRSPTASRCRRWGRTRSPSPSGGSTRWCRCRSARWRSRSSASSSCRS